MPFDRRSRYDYGGEKTEDDLEEREVHAPTPGKRTRTESLRRPSLGSGGPGNPLPETMLGQLERAFATDFSGVRMHRDGDAEALGAEAYARGEDFFFGPNIPEPTSARGMDVLAHELTHVVQQRQGRAAQTGFAGGMPLGEHAGLEAEAHDVAHRLSSGQALPAALLGSRPGAEPRVIQRMTINFEGEKVDLTTKKLRAILVLRAKLMSQIASAKRAVGDAKGKGDAAGGDSDEKIVVKDKGAPEEIAHTLAQVEEYLRKQLTDPSSLLYRQLEFTCEQLTEGQPESKRDRMVREKREREESQAKQKDEQEQKKAAKEAEKQAKQKAIQTRAGKGGKKNENDDSKAPAEPEPKAPVELIELDVQMLLELCDLAPAMSDIWFLMHNAMRMLLSGSEIVNGKTGSDEKSSQFDLDTYLEMAVSQYRQNILEEGAWGDLPEAAAIAEHHGFRCNILKKGADGKLYLATTIGRGKANPHPLYHTGTHYMVLTPAAAPGSPAPTDEDRTLVFQDPAKDGDCLFASLLILITGAQIVQDTESNEGKTTLAEINELRALAAANADEDAIRLALLDLMVDPRKRGGGQRAALRLGLGTELQSSFALPSVAALAQMHKDLRSELLRRGRGKQLKTKGKEPPSQEQIDAVAIADGWFADWQLLRGLGAAYAEADKRKNKGGGDKGGDDKSGDDKSGSDEKKDDKAAKNDKAAKDDKAAKNDTALGEIEIEMVGLAFQIQALMDAIMGRFIHVQSGAKDVKVLGPSEVNTKATSFHADEMRPDSGKGDYCTLHHEDAAKDLIKNKTRIDLPSGMQSMWVNFKECFNEKKLNVRIDIETYRPRLSGLQRVKIQPGNGQQGGWLIYCAEPIAYSTEILANTLAEAVRDRCYIKVWPNNKPEPKLPGEEDDDGDK